MGEKKRFILQSHSQTLQIVYKKKKKKPHLLMLKTSETSSDKVSKKFWWKTPTEQKRFDRYNVKGHVWSSNVAAEVRVG